MKAVWIEGYGGPEVVRFGERPDPVPGPRDVLVAVKAASINPIDWKLRQGLLRADFALPMPYILGRDMSGVVTAAGPEVAALAPGDEVFGMADRQRGGTHAELVACDHQLLAQKPRKVGHIEAAAMALVGATAVAALEDTAGLAKGERVLIHGGAGGVGAFAVQLAKHHGAWVAATCSAANRDFVASLGADRVIDYKREDFAALLSGLDLVFDTVGGEVHRRSMGVLKPGGRLVHIAAAPLPAEPPRRDITIARANVRGQRALFERIAALIDDGAVRADIGAVLPLSEAGRGYEMSRAREVRGKIVLKIADPDPSLPR